MRWILVFLFLSSCDAFKKQKIVFPDKPLQEIILYGHYSRVEIDGEIKEDYVPEVRQKYCYKRTEEDKKFKSFDKISKGFLKAQLYSQEGRLLTETFFMMRKYDDLSNDYFSEAYLSYDPEAYEKRIVRVEGDKEILLYKKKMLPMEELVESLISESTSHPHGDGPHISSIHWHYYPEIECFSNP